MTPLEQSIVELRANQFEVFEYEHQYRFALDNLWEPPIAFSRSRNWTSGDDASAHVPAPGVSESRPDLFSDIKFSLEVPDPTPWSIAFTPTFRKSIQAVDKKMQGRVLLALAELAEKPVERLGDTVKPLAAGLKGMWRYRIGDYRLVYEPLTEKRMVVLVDFGARGGVYED